MSINTYKEWLREAYLQAQKSLNEGGLPIGSVLVDGKGQIDLFYFLALYLSNKICSGLRIHQYVTSAISADIVNTDKPVKIPLATNTEVQPKYAESTPPTAELPAQDTRLKLSKAFHLPRDRFGL